MNSVSIRKIPEGMEETESGLVLPADLAEEKRTAERVQERWLEDEWKKHRRTFRDYLKRNISILLRCDDCRSQITLRERDNNSFSLQCNCKDRIVVKGA